MNFRGDIVLGMAAGHEGRTLFVLGQHAAYFRVDQVVVDRQDIELSYRGKDGMDVLGDNGFLLALDKTLTPALREEGIANELNRLIQDLRKTAGYAVSDRIELAIEGELEPAWHAHLLKLALAEPVELSEAKADATTRETIEGRAFRIAIRKKNP